MKKQGKVTSKPVLLEELKAGMILIIDDGTIITAKPTYKGGELAILVGGIGLLSKVGEDYCEYDKKVFINRRVRTLIVEVSTECTTCGGDGEIEDNGPKACNHCGGNSYICIDIPLKYSQWQSAIDNNEVDSDKTVEFEIISNDDDISYAKIIPQKDTWVSISEKAYEEWKEVGGLSSFEPWYIVWLEDNYLPPKKK